MRKRDVLGTTVTVLFLLSAILYCSLLTELVMGYPLNPITAYLSELAARDQSTSDLVRIMDGTSAGLILLAIVLLMVRNSRGRKKNSSLHERNQHNRAYLLWIVGLVVLAVGTIMDTFWPLDCAVSLDTCQFKEQAGQVSLTHKLHDYSSVIAGFGGFLVGLSALWLFRFHKNFGIVRLARMIGWCLVVSTVVISFWGLTGLPDGLIQRVQILATCILIAISGPVLLSRENK